MKARTKFREIYSRLPEKATHELICFYSMPHELRKPYSIYVIKEEIMQDTPLSQKLLKQLGFEDD